MSQEDDLRLLKDCLAGTSDARDAFVRAFQGLVASEVRRSAGRPLENGRVDELCQEVYLALFEQDARKLRQFDPARGILAAWITRVARQVAWKRLGHVIPEGSSLRGDREAPSEENGSEDRERLRASLAALPPRQALCLRLLYERGLGASEAAALLGISRQALYELKDRALERLRKSESAP